MGSHANAAVRPLAPVVPRPGRHRRPMRTPKTEKDKSSKRKRVVLTVFTVVVILAILATAGFFSESPLLPPRCRRFPDVAVTCASFSRRSQEADRQQIFLLQALGEVHTAGAGLQREGRLRGRRG